MRNVGDEGVGCFNMYRAICTELLYLYKTGGLTLHLLISSQLWAIICSSFRSATSQQLTLVAVFWRTRHYYHCFNPLVRVGLHDTCTMYSLFGYPSFAFLFLSTTMFLGPRSSTNSKLSWSLVTFDKHQYNYTLQIYAITTQTFEDSDIKLEKKYYCNIAVHMWS